MCSPARTRSRTPPVISLGCDESQPRLPVDRQAPRLGAGAARGPRAGRPHRGRRDRRRRGRALLGLPAAGRGAARACAARRHGAVGGRGVHRALGYRGAVMADLPEPDVERTHSPKPDVARATPPEPDATRADLPEPEVAREWLETMTLIRRFEERAGEMYARAKVGGFLHLSIGEEATIVRSARALP